MLVSLQLGLAVVLFATTRLAAPPALRAAALALLAAGALLGLAALAANRPGNFNIRPELKPNARLITHGVYRFVRHPMYSAFLLVLAAAVALDPRAWRVLSWLALVAVLIVKAKREEGYLAAAYPEYVAYAARTKRFVPFVY
jgi:protein-S-isoprenylcysteine O-methyltransferase Ste14